MSEDHAELKNFILRKMDAGDEAEQIVAEVDSKRGMGRLWAIERVLEANDGRLGRHRESELRAMEEAERQRMTTSGRSGTQDPEGVPERAPGLDSAAVITFIRRGLRAGHEARHVIDDLVQEGYGRHDVTELTMGVLAQVPSRDGKAILPPGAAMEDEAPVSVPSRRSYATSRASRTSSDADWSLNSASTGSFIIAAIAAAIGGGLTLATYSAATAEGGSGTYRIFWGAVAFGGVAFIQGLVRLGDEGKASAGSVALACISLALILASGAAILTTL